jgi:hypothetical protein
MEGVVEVGARPRKSSYPFFRVYLMGSQTPGENFLRDFQSWPREGSGGSCREIWPSFPVVVAVLLHTSGRARGGRGAVTAAHRCGRKIGYEGSYLPRPEVTV